jgi:transcriptional regulator
MYLPGPFQLTDAAELAHVLERYPFATLVGCDAGEPVVDHLPLLADWADRERPVLHGHLARANRLPKRLPDGARVTAVFHGPDTYVTPSAYPSKRRDPRHVPTWNYVVVHASGRLRWFDGIDELHALVDALSRRHEAAHGSDWRIADAPADYVAAHLRAIVGLRIEVDTLVGKAKASQNRAAEDRGGVREWLRSRGRAADEVEALVREPRAPD